MGIIRNLTIISKKNNVQTRIEEVDGAVTVDELLHSFNSTFHLKYKAHQASISRFNYKQRLTGSTTLNTLGVTEGETLVVDDTVIHNLEIIVVHEAGIKWRWRISVEEFTLSVASLLALIEHEVVLPLHLPGIVIRRATNSRWKGEPIEDRETLIVYFDSPSASTFAEKEIFSRVVLSENIPSGPTQNLSILVETTGQKILVEKIDRNTTADEILSALAYKFNFPTNTRGALIRKVTRKQLIGSQTLSDAGIEDGEILIADYERTAGGSIIFYPDGKIEKIDVTPEEMLYLAEILREIRLLHESANANNKQSESSTLNTTEIKIAQVDNSTIVIAGNNVDLQSPEQSDTGK